METAFLKLLLIASVSVGLLGKYIYVPERKTWPEAQRYCRERYTDLAPISRKRDVQKLREMAGDGLNHCAFVGLHRDPDDTSGRWRWSGGGYASNLAWCDGQEPSLMSTDYVVFCWDFCHGVNGWHSVSNFYTYEFFCLNVIIVRERKTWEEALMYCRKNHSDLASLSSETEVLLAQREIQGEETTERVWTSLRYLADRWLWLNGDGMRYEAWPQGAQRHQCPTESHLCGVMTKEGLWESWDCKERLNFLCY